LASTWLNFEAGAHGKVVDDTRDVPLLYKDHATDVARPLGMLMAKPLHEKGVKATLIAINNGLTEDAVWKPLLWRARLRQCGRS
jgi:hypothetical protein